MPEPKKEIYLTLDMLKGATTEKKKENDFSSEELLFLTLGSGEMKAEGKALTPAEKLKIQLSTLFSHLSESRSKNKGFYWEYYVPYFAALQKEGYVETLIYVMQASSDNQEVQDWLNSHGKEIEAFYTWTKHYDWKY